MRNGLIVDRDGTQRWFLNDQLHRDNDLPAVIDIYGYQQWYINGECHRENGPAVISANGHQEWWYHHGLCHRENGLPAVIDTDDGSHEWYIDGKRISISIEEWIKDNNLPSWESWDETTWSLFRLEFL